jgi:TolB-like protein/Tfp pilus assembly protein PilF
MAMKAPVSTGKGRKLDSWKEIADYLDRDVRSVQRWERSRGLPIYRVPGLKIGGVFAYTAELDEWLHSRRERQPEDEATESTPAEADSQASATTAPSQPKPENNTLAQRAVSGRKLVWPLLAAVALLSLVAAVAAHRASRPTKPASTRIMLAVLPFQNLSGDPAQEYFADGLTEEMITDLGKLNPQAMGVIARTSAMKYKSSKEDVGQIARALGVGYVLEGSVRRVGNQARISAQLIQVSDQSHLWAQNYQRDVKDILSVQADVARAIADKVQVKLNPHSPAHVADAKPANPEAYDDYLEGLYAWNERTVASMTKGAEYFERAVEQDPNYAAAYAGMAQCYTLLGMDRVPNIRELLAKAKTAALRAVELDDSSAEAHVALGGVRVFADFDWPDAEAEFKRAIELNPNNAQAHHWYANLYLDPQGRYEEAIAEMKRAQELDPLSLIINTDLGYAYYVAGRDADAGSQFRKVMNMDPNFVPAMYDLYLLDLKRKDDLGAWRDRLAGLRVSVPSELRSKMEEVYNRAGYRGVEQEVAASQGTFGLRDYPKSVWDAAQAYAYLGEKDRAISFLETSYEQRNPAIIYIKCDPYWTSLHFDPRFQDLERKLGVLQ